jgi:hypothetical protein
MAIPEYLPGSGARQPSGYQRDTTAGDESTRTSTKRPMRPMRPTKETKMIRTRLADLSAGGPMADGPMAHGPMVGGPMALTATPAVATPVMEGLS